MNVSCEYFFFEIFVKSLVSPGNKDAWWYDDFWQRFIKSYHWTKWWWIDMMLVSSGPKAISMLTGIIINHSYARFAVKLTIAFRLSSSYPLASLRNFMWNSALIIMQHYLCRILFRFHICVNGEIWIIGHPAFHFSRTCYLG